MKEKTFNIFIFFSGLFLSLVLIIDMLNLPPFIDEKNLVFNVVHFITNKTIIPYYANYPSFYSYFISLPIYIVFTIVYLIKGYPLSGINDIYFLRFFFMENELSLFWAARIISIILSVCLLIILLKHSYRRYGSLAAFITAALMILDPLNVYARYSRFALPEILVSFLLFVVLLLCLKYIEEKASSSALIGASFIAGLAMSSKLNATMIISPLFLSPLLRNEREWTIYFKIFIGAAAGFLLGSPAVLFAPQVYLNGFGVESDILFKTHSPVWQQTRWIWLFNILWNRNPLLTLLMILSLGYSAYKHTKWDILFLSLSLFSIVILGGLDKRALEYFIFLYPLFYLQIGRFLSSSLLEGKETKTYAVSIFVLFLALSSMAFNLCLKLREGLTSDNRNIAKSWIETNIPEGKSIIMDKFYLPSLKDKNIITKNFINKVSTQYKPILEESYNQNRHYNLIHITSMPCDIYQYDLIMNADYLIVSNYNYNKFLKPSGDDPSLSMQIPEKEFKERSCFYKNLLGGSYPFQLMKNFSSGSGPVISLFEKKKIITMPPVLNEAVMPCN